MISLINRIPSWQKTLLAMCHDLFMAAICFYLSISIRIGSLSLEEIINASPFYKSLIIVSIIQFLTFYAFGLYRGIWRYSSTYDLIRLIKGVSAGVVLSYMSLFFLFRLSGIPRSSIIIDWFLLIVTLGGGRLAYRLIRDHDFKIKNRANPALKRILIVGAGSAGEQLLREIRKNINLPFEIVGFIDDDPFKQKKMLHGVKVLSDSKGLPHQIESLNINEIFLAIPSATGKEIKNILEICKGLDVTIKTLPKMSDIINGYVEVSQLRNVNIVDLLGRKQIDLDQHAIKSMIHNKRVLISGAGGSIGSELVKQIVQFEPKQLFLIDLSEINLFNLERTIQEISPNNNHQFIIADVRDSKNLEQIFNKAKPEMVLHAAAYKHVPLMEHNPLQAIRTNVFGTFNMANLSVQHNVKNFVLVSTDKAVNPTNVMGTSKRIAEIVCQDFQRKTHETHFTTVRFGNVLGSSGSVIPIFKEQILKGGPITVTHPDIQRFFMSIPEASQLILQAATLGNGGEIFVLDMGEPVKIVDLAKQLIKLANLEEGKDIEIKFTGLRPGEKLFEELLADKESTLPTSHPLVRTAKSRIPSEDIINKILDLFSLKETSREEIKTKLLEIVPEYDPEQNQNQIFTSKDQSLKLIH